MRHFLFTTSVLGIFSCLRERLPLSGDVSLVHLVVRTGQETSRPKITICASGPKWGKTLSGPRIPPAARGVRRAIDPQNPVRITA